MLTHRTITTAPRVDRSCLAVRFRDWRVRDRILEYRLPINAITSRKEQFDGVLEFSAFRSDLLKDLNSSRVEENQRPRLFTAGRATSGDLRKGLVEGGRGQAGSQGSQRAGRVIVAAQIAITLVLVVGAALLGRSLMKVLEVNPGFRVDKIVTMDVSLPWVDDPKANQALFFSNLIDRLKQIPGVRKVGATSGLPLDGGLPDGMFLLMRQDEVPKTTDGLWGPHGALFQQKERIGIADFCVATDGYFQVLGIPLIRGRIFDERDGANAPHVAVISESLVRDRWPKKQDPIGHTIEFGNMDGDLRLLTIVGIMDDIYEYGLDAPPRATVYVNLFQRPRAAITVTMLSDADTRLVTSAARGILQDLLPGLNHWYTVRL